MSDDRPSSVAPSETPQAQAERFLLDSKRTVSFGRRDTQEAKRLIEALRSALAASEARLLDALKAEGQKDAWIEMLSQSLRSIVVAVSDDDNWEGSVADGIDLLNAKFVEVNASLAASEAGRRDLQTAAQRAFVILEGLHLAVVWELAPSIKQEIAEVAALLQSILRVKENESPCS